VHLSRGCVAELLHHVFFILAWILVCTPPGFSILTYFVELVSSSVWAVLTMFYGGNICDAVVCISAVCNLC
jgi:hypothetical protein